MGRMEQQIIREEEDQRKIDITSSLKINHHNNKNNKWFKVVRLKRDMTEICETLVHINQKTFLVLVHSIAQEWEELGRVEKEWKLGQLL